MHDDEDEDRTYAPGDMLRIGHCILTAQDAERFGLMDRDTTTGRLRMRFTDEAAADRLSAALRGGGE
jgi:hypothetical protein